MLNKAVNNYTEYGKISATKGEQMIVETTILVHIENDKNFWNKHDILEAIENDCFEFLKTSVTTKEGANA